MQMKEWNCDSEASLLGADWVLHNVVQELVKRIPTYLTQRKVINDQFHL